MILSACLFRSSFLLLDVALSFLEEGNRWLFLHRSDDPQQIPPVPSDSRDLCVQLLALSSTSSRWYVYIPEKLAGIPENLWQCSWFPHLGQLLHSQRFHFYARGALSRPPFWWLGDSCGLLSFISVRNSQS